jgi:hypothetical protein
MTIPISGNHSKCQPYLNSHSKLKWSKHALERKEQRSIDIDPTKVNINEVIKLPFYTNNGCYHYCDSKKGVTYYVRYSAKTSPQIVTIIKRNPIAMARRVCEIKGWCFQNICRDHLFGNCLRSSCRYEHRSI